MARGTVAVELVVLREAAGRLRPARVAAGREAHGEVAELVVRHEEREAEALLVVDAPLPLAAQIGVTLRDRRGNQRLDGLGHGAQSAISGTPAIVSSATRSTTECRWPLSAYAASCRSALVPSRMIVSR